MVGWEARSILSSRVAFTNLRWAGSQWAYNRESVDWKLAGEGARCVLGIYPRKPRVLITQLSLATFEWAGPSGPNYLQSRAQELHIDAQRLVPSKTFWGYSENDGTRRRTGCRLRMSVRGPGDGGSLPDGRQSARARCYGCEGGTPAGLAATYATTSTINSATENNAGTGKMKRQAITPVASVA